MRWLLAVYSCELVFFVAAHRQSNAPSVINHFEDSASEYLLSPFIEVRGSVTDAAENCRVTRCHEFPLSLELGQRTLLTRRIRQVIFEIVHALQKPVVQVVVSRQFDDERPDPP